jgi:hypothetical protein
LVSEAATGQAETTRGRFEHGQPNTASALLQRLRASSVVGLGTLAIAALCLLRLEVDAQAQDAPFELMQSVHESLELAQHVAAAQTMPWSSPERRARWQSWALARFEGQDLLGKALLLRAFEDPSLSSAWMTLCERSGLSACAPFSTSSALDLEESAEVSDQRATKKYRIFEDFDTIEARSALPACVLDEPLRWDASAPCRPPGGIYPIIDDDFSWLRAAAPELKLEYELHPTELHLRDLRLRVGERAATFVGLSPLLAVSVRIFEHSLWLLQAAELHAPARARLFEGERVVLTTTSLDLERTKTLAFRLMRHLCQTGEEAEARVLELGAGRLLWLHIKPRQLAGSTLGTRAWLMQLEAWVD